MPPNARLSPFLVSRVHSDYAGRLSLLPYGRVEARDPADAVRVAHGLRRRPAKRHDGACSGYRVGDGIYLAAVAS